MARTVLQACVGTSESFCCVSKCQLLIFSRAKSDNFLEAARGIDYCITVPYHVPSPKFTFPFVTYSLTDVYIRNQLLVAPPKEYCILVDCLVQVSNDPFRSNDIYFIRLFNSRLEHAGCIAYVQPSLDGPIKKTTGDALVSCVLLLGKRFGLHGFIVSQWRINWAFYRFRSQRSSNCQ